MGILPYADAKVVTFHETTKYFGKNLMILIYNNVGQSFHNSCKT